MSNPPPIYISEIMSEETPNAADIPSDIDIPLGHPSSFLANLFDPALVDPSFTEPSTATVTTDNPLGADNSSADCILLGGGNCNSTDSERNLSDEQDIYFVLVITTCSLTVLVAVTVLIYRVIESALSGGGRGRGVEGGVAGQQRGGGASVGGVTGLGGGLGGEEGVVRGNNVEFITGNENVFCIAHSRKTYH